MRVRVELHLAIVAIEVDVGHVLPSILAWSLKCVFSFHDTGLRRVQVLNFMRDKLPDEHRGLFQKKTRSTHHSRRTLVASMDAATLTHVRVIRDFGDRHP